MPPPFQLRRPLAVPPPDPLPAAGVCVRNFAGPRDEAPWLELRRAAFADESPAVRPWTEADFRAELSARPGWRDDWLWLAERGRDLVGTVALVPRGGERVALHWLMVHPDWRRHGIARLLLAHLHRAAWEAGFREVWLETHPGWSSAVEFYGRLGYARSSPAR